MKSPQEKAKELVEKFYKYAHKGDSTISAEECAKQCALIAIDEILNEIGNKTLKGITHPIFLYWQKVRKEIEKL